MTEPKRTKVLFDEARYAYDPPLSTKEPLVPANDSSEAVREPRISSTYRGVADLRQHCEATYSGDFSAGNRVVAVVFLVI